MDRSRFRGPSPESYVSHTPSFRVDVKELKKIKVEIKRSIPGVEAPQQEIDRSLDRPEEITIYRCHERKAEDIKEEYETYGVHGGSEQRKHKQNYFCEGNRPIFARQDIVVNKEEPEHRTVSTQSPRRSPRRSPKRNRSSPSPRRDTRRSSVHSVNARSPRRNSNRRDTPRREISRTFRNRSRSRESSRRSRRSPRSRSRSARREFARRRNTRSPDDRDRRRHERNDYRHLERNGRRERSRSPRYTRSPGRRRSRSRPPHMAPLDPNTLGAIPLIIPPDINFYGPDDTIWFPAPLRPPMMVPRGLLPPRGMYRAPMYGVRPPLPPRPPYVPLQRPPQFGQIRGGLNRPRVPQ